MYSSCASAEAAFPQKQIFGNLRRIYHLVTPYSACLFLHLFRSSFLEIWETIFYQMFKGPTLSNFFLWCWPPSCKIWLLDEKTDNHSLIRGRSSEPVVLWIPLLLLINIRLSASTSAFIVRTIYPDLFLFQNLWIFFLTKLFIIAFYQGFGYLL